MYWKAEKDIVRILILVICLFVSYMQTYKDMFCWICKLVIFYLLTAGGWYSWCCPWNSGCKRPIGQSLSGFGSWSSFLWHHQKAGASSEQNRYTQTLTGQRILLICCVHTVFLFAHSINHEEKRQLICLLFPLI